MKKALITGLSFTLLIAANASASPIVYRGSNPHINPNAFAAYEASITNSANLTKPKNTGQSAQSRAALSESTLLKQSIISSLSTTYVNRLTQNCPSCGGTIDLGDGSTIEYSTANGIRTIIFRDAVLGTATEISFPL